MGRHFILSMAMVAFSAVAMSAQRSPATCGTGGLVGDAREILTGWLSRPLVVVANNEVDTLPAISSTDATKIVTDTHLCGPVLSAGLKALRDGGQLESFQETGFVHRIYRAGPYYVAVFSDAPPSDHAVRSGHFTLNLSPDFILFFDRASLKYLGQVLISG